jgi:hypothetical protein
MTRLREVLSDGQFNVKARMLPTFEIVEAPPWPTIKNLLSRFRPVYLDSEKVSFRSIVKIIPKHAALQPGVETYDEMERRWDGVLSGTTAPIPVGAVITGPGFVGVSEEVGTLTLGFDGEILTGQEVIDLSLYGELVHIDLGKERKLLRINESFVAPGYRFAVISVLTELVRTADQLRAYAADFVELFRKTLGDEKLREIETEFDR